MTLFVETKNRQYEINELYLMATVFIITYVITRIVKKAIINYYEKKKTVNVPNPTGGDLFDPAAYDSDLANSILTVISNDKSYVVKNPTIRKMIFELAALKISNASLVLTPNMIRFLALKLLKNDKSLVVKVGSMLLTAQSRKRMATRLSSSIITGIMAGVGFAVPAGVLMALMSFSMTENRGYQCEQYFEQLPSEGPIRVFDKQSTGHLVIAGNEAARQVEIYVPLQAPNQVESVKETHTRVQKITSYSKSRTKAKAVNFSDFKKNDPVLSVFDNLEEPTVPQRKCDVSQENMLD